MITRANTFSASPPATVTEEEEGSRATGATTSPNPELSPTARRRNSTGDMILYKNMVKRPISLKDTDDDSTDTPTTTSDKTQTPSDSASADVDWETSGEKEGKTATNGAEGKGQKVTFHDLQEVADPGNRLSQMQVPVEIIEVPSVVDVCYEL